MKNLLKLIILTTLFTFTGCITFPTCFKHPCVLIPGNSKATPVMQTEAAGSLFETVDVDNCRNFKVINTEYKGHKSKLIWNEEWTISACGRKFKETVIFGPHGDVAHGLWLEEVK